MIPARRVDLDAGAFMPHNSGVARPWKELGRYGGVGIDLVLGILILGGIGHWLDERYGRGRDVGMLVGFLLGVAVGIRNLVVVAARMQRDIERAEAADPLAHRWAVDESWVYRTEAESPPSPPAAADDEGAHGP